MIEKIVVLSTNDAFLTEQLIIDENFSQYSHMELSSIFAAIIERRYISKFEIDKRFNTNKKIEDWIYVMCFLSHLICFTKKFIISIFSFSVLIEVPWIKLARQHLKWVSIWITQLSYSQFDFVSQADSAI